MTESKRREICTVAAKLFAQKGFENISTRDISKAVGLSDAGMVLLFQEQKEALLYEILHGILKTGLETVREIDQSTKSHEEKLIAFTKFYTLLLFTGNRGAEASGGGTEEGATHPQEENHPSSNGSISTSWCGFGWAEKRKGK